MMSYIFIGLILLVLSTILVYSSDIMFGVNLAKEFYFYGIIILILYCVIPCILICGNKKLDINYLDIMILLFCLWCFIRNPFHSMKDTENVKIIAFSVLYFSVRMFTNYWLKKEAILPKQSVSIIAIVFFVIAIIEIIFGLLQLYNILPSFNNNFSITGTTSNPAVFSMFLAVVYPVALAWHLLASSYERNKYDKYSKILSLIVILMILSIVPLTMIRAAWIGIIGSSIIVLCFCNGNFLNIIKSKLKNKRRIFIIISSVLIVVLSSICLYNLKSKSAFGRLLIWEITLKEIKKNPLLGIGYKQYQVEYNNWQANYFIEKKRTSEKENVADSVVFSYNEYLQIVAEIGIVGFLLFVFIIYYFIKKIYYRLKMYERARAKNSLEFRLVISAFSCLISILLMALVSYPFQILPIKIILVICMGVLSSNLGCGKLIISKYLNIKCNYSTKIIFVCLLICVSIIMFDQIFKIPSYMKWKEAVIEYNNKKYSVSAAIYKEIYPNMYNNGLFLLYYGTTLIANNDCQGGVHILEYAKKRISDPIIYIKIGDCKKNIKDYKRAEENYLFASAMIPNRIYPKYLLALLFDENQQYDKAYKYAKDIISTEEKVSSTAIFEMKKVMMDLIRKYEEK